MNKYFFLMNDGSSFSSNGSSLYDAFCKAKKGVWDNIAEWEFETDPVHLGE